MSTGPRAVAPAATGTRMRAVVQDTYGGPEVLRLDEIDRPSAGNGEVLVRVVAAGLDRGAWHLMTGAPYPLRLAGYGVRAPKNPVRGRELAGVVAAVGAGVTRFAAGDEVFGIAEGTFAEYAVARQDRLAAKPAGVTFEQAAAVPISATTALQAVRDHGKVAAGQKVLVIGASGGVGSFAVQIAKAFGAEVTGVCSPGKVDLVRSLGADSVLDYTRDDLPADARYDVVLDAGGHRPLRTLRRALAPKGTLVIIGSETGGRWLGGLDRLLRAMALSPFVGQKLGGFVASEKAEDLIVLGEMVDAGTVAPTVDRTYPLTDVAAAMRHLIDGRARGKVVVTVQDESSR
jgi:NADPH:quinone reductase-like Zn-dependent oxidoreductase